MTTADREYLKGLLAILREAGVKIPPMQIGWSDSGAQIGGLVAELESVLARPDLTATRRPR